MSKINPGLYSSEDQTWQTPPELVEAILKFEGRSKFDLDAASSIPNIPALFHYRPDGLYTSDRKVGGYWEDKCGLSGNWDVIEEYFFGSALIFVNPPYGDNLKKFIKKAFEESLKGSRIWALIPARTETIYQHEYGLTQAGFTVFMKGRLKFLQNGVSKGTAPFPTMLLYYGSDWEKKAKRWVKEQPIPGTLMVRGS